MYTYMCIYIYIYIWTRKSSASSHGPIHTIQSRPHDLAPQARTGVFGTSDREKLAAEKGNNSNNNNNNSNTYHYYNYHHY